MECPKCQGLLNKVLFEEVQVERCSSCSGLWFDATELNQLLAMKGAERIDSGDKRDFQKTSSIEDYRCPKDGSKMIKMVDAKQGHVWYESCGICKGIFLDATEFKDLKGKSVLDFVRTLLTPQRKA